MDLSVVIVSFNVRELLANCLKSLRKELKREKDFNSEIIVIDNASSDGSAKLVKKIIDSGNDIKIKLIENNQNLGFARAVNQGIKISEARYILLLNPDTITKPGAIKSIINFAENHPQAGVIGGKLLDPDGKIQGSCYYLPSVSRAIKQLFSGSNVFFSKYAPTDKFPVEVEAVTGGSFLISKRIIQKIGTFDTSYFMYFEDLDYCRRAKKAGYKVYYLPSAQFIHYHGASGAAIPQKTNHWLVESSKIYHGQVKYWLITVLLWLDQKMKGN